jgi:hypothetical protein
MNKYLYGFLLLLFVSCTSRKEPSREASLNSLSHGYIKLALKVGQYSPDYIDAYYGPDSLKPKQISEEATKNFPADSLEKATDSLIDGLKKINTKDSLALIKLRQEYLLSQARAVKTFIRIKGGAKLTFDEEAKLLYEGTPRSYAVEHFDSLLKKLDKILPGKGEVSDRLEEYRKGFIIPKEKLDTVFQFCIKEARERTLKHFQLPSSENFKLEYVTDKPWSGYNDSD